MNFSAPVQMISEKAMLTVALAALVLALFMAWRCRTTKCPYDADKYQRFAVAAGVVAAVAGFLHYRRRSVIDGIASQYLISPDDF